MELRSISLIGSIQRVMKQYDIEMRVVEHAPERREILIVGP